MCEVYPKRKQLTKRRSPNPKKMTDIEYRIYVDFVNERAGYMCQCGCGNTAQDIHHAQFGAGGRDDRSIVAICRECHHTIHHGRDTDKASRLKLLCKGIGKDNWRAYVLYGF